MLYFDWDEKKSKSNLKKHGISFHEAGTVFDDPLALTFPDPDHSGIENRYLTFGLSTERHFLVVAHTDRGNKIRIISARLMTKQERKIYEEG